MNLLDELYKVRPQLEEATHNPSLSIIQELAQNLHSVVRVEAERRKDSALIACEFVLDGYLSKEFEQCTREQDNHLLSACHISFSELCRVDGSNFKLHIFTDEDERYMIKAVKRDISELQMFFRDGDRPPSDFNVFATMSSILLNLAVLHTNKGVGTEDLYLLMDRTRSPEYLPIVRKHIRKFDGTNAVTKLELERNRPVEAIADDEDDIDKLTQQMLHHQKEALRLGEKIEALRDRNK
jgi:hypothetical protein